MQAKEIIVWFKQATQTWFLRFTSFLTHLNFCASKADSSLFILHTPKETTYLLLYVDDIILTANSNSFLSSIINKLRAEFSMTVTDLGPLEHFLGDPSQNLKLLLFKTIL